MHINGLHLNKEFILNSVKEIIDSSSKFSPFQLFTGLKKRSWGLKEKPSAGNGAVGRVLPDHFSSSLIIS